jgi:hypothetical protein
MALAQLADLNVDTIRATVYSRLAITIMGETAPASNSATQYVALVHGTPPFTYRWNLDGNVISTDQTISLTFGPSEEHSLTVSAWDSQGDGATEGLIIDSMNGGNAYYRAPVPNSGSPLRGITKKGVVP